MGHHYTTGCVVSMVLLLFTTLRVVSHARETERKPLRSSGGLWSGSLANRSRWPPERTSQICASEAS